MAASASPRTRVLHVVLDLNAGGLERLVADMVRLGDATEFEYHVLALRFLGRFGEGLEAHAKLHTAPPMGKLSLIRPMALSQQLAAIAPDVIHTHSGVWYKASLAARQAGLRAIILHTDHGRNRPDPWKDRFVDWLASRRTDVVVAVSDVLADQLRRTVVAHPERVRTILNGVDTAEFAPRTDDGVLRRELALGPEVPIIGSIGRLEHIKGYDLMVEAFALLAAERQGPDAPVLFVAGDGEEEARLAERVRELGLQARIKLAGWRRDLATLYRAFTFFTMTSRSEGTSVSLLEAMSAGLCPVVTDVGGNPVVLGEALRHRLVPSLEPREIATAWGAALDDHARRRVDGASARARVEAHFSLVRMVRDYEALYRAGLEASPPMPAS